MTLNVRGPERVALVGSNGAGKTTLLRTITGELPPAAGEVRLAVPARLLPQRLDVLDPDLPSVRHLTEALRCFRGALLVASHDVPFLRELGLTRWLRLDAGLAEVDPL